jgi:hypothetical protein
MVPRDQLTSRLARPIRERKSGPVLLVRARCRWA